MKFGLKGLSILALVSIISGAALSAGPKPTLCPVCHMPLTMKKSKANPTAVRLTKGGKVMYCCGKCKMPASVLVKGK